MYGLPSRFLREIPSALIHEAVSYTHLDVYKRQWLSHVNASVLKVKLAMAIIGISSIHLLKTCLLYTSRCV